MGSAIADMEDSREKESPYTDDWRTSLLRPAQISGAIPAPDAAQRERSEVMRR
jgi:hypothetical protein